MHRQLSTSVTTAVWLLLMFCVAKSRAVLITPTQSLNTTVLLSDLDNSGNNDHFGPATISSLIVAVFGALFGLLALVPCWILLRNRKEVKIHHDINGTTRLHNTASSGVTDSDPEPGNQANINSHVPDNHGHMSSRPISTIPTLLTPSDPTTTPPVDFPPESTSPSPTASPSTTITESTNAHDNHNHGVFGLQE
ncbi:hypothetical protein K440DRAFT_667869 [Wilcoxina mikolae CBS 423.85]|nr:hypothetical protein K440DRAFT_667869 [Wilcoxina mikolae CBS 423.85]